MCSCSLGSKKQSCLDEDLSLQSHSVSYRLCASMHAQGLHPSSHAFPRKYPVAGTSKIQDKVNGYNICAFLQHLPLDFRTSEAQSMVLHWLRRNAPGKAWKRSALPHMCGYSAHTVELLSCDRLPPVTWLSLCAHEAPASHASQEWGTQHQSNSPATVSSCKSTIHCQPCMVQRCTISRAACCTRTCKLPQVALRLIAFISC